MKSFCCIMFLVLVVARLFGAAPTITNVSAYQRYPWNGLVDISVTFRCDAGDEEKVEFVFSATNTANQMSLPVVSISRNGADKSDGVTWKRNFVWDAVTDISTVKHCDVALTVSAVLPYGGVQLWSGGPYWSECNIGAAKPYSYGDYFWWGDSVGYRYDGSQWNAWDNSVVGFYFDSSNCPTYNKDKSQLQSLGYIDSKGNLVAVHDAATVRLGEPWRMPTRSELYGLTSWCRVTWVSTNEVYGMLFTGQGEKYASKSIFLPAAGYHKDHQQKYGYYWSSTYTLSNSHFAYAQYFSSSSSGSQQCSMYDRFFGFSIRPIRDAASGRGVASNNVTVHLSLDTQTATRYARSEEPISFSTDWNDGVNRLVLNVEGENVLTTTTPTNGVYLWKPDFTTAHTASLWLMTRGTTTVVTTATFMVEAFNVTFSPGTHGAFADGVATTQRIPHGSNAIQPTVYPASGYEFTGWSSDVTCVTNDLNVTAQYSIISYPITYTNLQGATSQNPTSYTIEDSITFASPSSMPRRKFLRWEPASLAVGTVGSQLVNAVWLETPYIYVDATLGEDVNYGGATNSAVRTLARGYELSEDGDIIYVASGIYDPVTATGKSVTFRGSDGATIDGCGISRCVTADDNIEFENLIIQNGYDADAGGGVRGGTFKNCTIRACRSDFDGGGAYDATLVDCYVVSNTTTYGYGGGVFGGTLTNCKVMDNKAGDIGGGAYAPKKIDGTTFYGNSPDNVAGDSAVVTSDSSFVYTPSDGAMTYSIPYNWLVTKGLSKVGDSTSDLKTKLTAKYSNGFTGWESFVAGLDPTNAQSVFVATVTISNGMVCIGWTPNLNVDETKRIYTLYGLTNIGIDEWETPIQPWHKFFKVDVSMPSGSDGERSSIAGNGFIPEKQLGGIRLWDNGPYWSECNIGATKPEDVGFYFYWGDTIGCLYTNDTWQIANGSNGGFSFTENNCATYNKTFSDLQSLGYIDSTGNLVATHDAATVRLGDPWRMPTDAEWEELISNCSTLWTVKNGVYGCLVTGRGSYASKSIFLPAAGDGFGSYLDSNDSLGYYWSSTSYLANAYSAWFFIFSSGSFSLKYGDRAEGFPIRPLRTE